MKKLCVAGAVFMLGLSAAVAQQDSIPTFDSLRVDGPTRMMENARAEENFTVGATFYYPNAPTFTGDLQNREIAVYNLSSGAVEKSTLESIQKEMYSKSCVTLNGDVFNPFWANGLNKIFNDCERTKVGVGTNDPQYKVDVRGNGYFQTGLRVGDIVTSSITVPALIQGERSLTYVNDWMRLSVKQANGTTQDRFLIQNNGTVWCTELHVTRPDSIPDYVFRPEYDLMPLDQLRAYVQDNHHLPKIPSEAEIKANGIAVGDMQMRLLEKIEELSLYILQLDEQNKALKDEIDALKTQH